MAKPRLHLDNDAFWKALHEALVDHHHDVTLTPNEWLAVDDSDEAQLLWATGQGRIIFTFNVRHFVELAKEHPILVKCKPKAVATEQRF